MQYLVVQFAYEKEQAVVIGVDRWAELNEVLTYIAAAFGMDPKRTRIALQEKELI